MPSTSIMMGSDCSALTTKNVTAVSCTMPAMVEQCNRPFLHRPVSGCREAKTKTEEQAAADKARRVDTDMHQGIACGVACPCVRRVPVLPAHTGRHC
eukprot:scaffold8551_cov132-Isochrysis_galbana.AAC.2